MAIFSAGTLEGSNTDCRRHEQEPSGRQHHEEADAQPPVGIPCHEGDGLTSKPNQRRRSTIRYSAARQPEPMRWVLSMTGKSHFRARMATMSPELSHHWKKETWTCGLRTRSRPHPAEKVHNRRLRLQPTIQTSRTATIRPDVIIAAHKRIARRHARRALRGGTGSRSTSATFRYTVRVKHPRVHGRQDQHHHFARKKTF